MKCQHNNKRCIDTRPLDNGFRRRRYECHDCKERFSTIELPLANAIQGEKSIEGFDESIYIISECQADAINNLLRLLSSKAEIFNDLLGKFKK